jgi:hypothetical protein
MRFLLNILSYSIIIAVLTVITFSTQNSIRLIQHKNIDLSYLTDYLPTIDLSEKVANVVVLALESDSEIN